MTKNSTYINFSRYTEDFGKTRQQIIDKYNNEKKEIEIFGRAEINFKIKDFIMNKNRDVAYSFDQNNHLYMINFYIEKFSKEIGLSKIKEIGDNLYRVNLRKDSNKKDEQNKFYYSGNNLYSRFVYDPGNDFLGIEITNFASYN